MNVKLITPAQVDYIKTLAEGADLTAVDPRTRAVVQVVQGEASRPVGRATASRAITELRKLQASTTPKSDNQVEYMLDLAVRKGVRDQITSAHLEKLTQESASKLIEALKGMPDAHIAPRRTAYNPNSVTDGMYQTSEGEVYKVQVAVHGSGRLYAKKLVALAEPRQLKNGVRTHEFVRAEGALAVLTPAMAMTQAQAAEFGKLYGACCNCGLTLTDETSIALGIGPKCRKSRGWV
jgi:hypothetical protein